MKTKITLVTTFIFLSVVFIFTLNRCTNEKSSQEAIMDTPSSLKSAEAAGPGWSVTCKGTCSDGTNCQVCGSSATPDKLWCCCEGCVMSVTIDTVCETLISQSKADYEMIWNSVQNYLEKTHGTDPTYFKKIQGTFYKSAELLEFWYVLGSNPDEFLTVVVAVVDDPVNSDAAPQAILVDCQGSCDTSTEKCVEVFDAIHYTVSCGCQSDSCHMIVNPIPDPGK